MKLFFSHKRLLLALSALLIAVPASAEDDPLKKLGRGLTNTFTGWVEIPKNIYETSEQENPVAGATLGLAKGAGMTIVRTGAGIFEVLTFPFQLPREYKPILEPETVFDAPQTARTTVAPTAPDASAVSAGSA